MKKLTTAAILILVLCMLAGCAAHGKQEGYYAIDHFYIKEEGDAFREAFNALTIETYRWYQSLEERDGVYIIHFEHYSKEQMDEWKQSGFMTNLPKGDLDYYTASLNYLEDRGMTFSDEDRQRIREGVRYYLLPDTLDEEEAAMMKRFLTEDALIGLDEEPLIDTVFRHERKIVFQTYSFDGTLEVPGGEEIKNPVIYVASCANMKFFEAESLNATGISDAYIRLTEEAYDLYAKNDLPRELKDKRMTFLNTQSMSN